MISALRDSFDDEGRRVCNPGKAHRLIVVVFQARLQGVNIGGEATATMVPLKLTL